MRNQGGSSTTETAARAGVAVRTVGCCGTSLGERVVLGEGVWVLGETALEPDALQPLGAQESGPSQLSVARLVLEPSEQPCGSSSSKGDRVMSGEVFRGPALPALHNPQARLGLYFGQTRALFKLVLFCCSELPHLVPSRDQLGQFVPAFGRGHDEHNGSFFG